MIPSEKFCGAGTCVRQVPGLIKRVPWEELASPGAVHVDLGCGRNHEDVKQYVRSRGWADTCGIDPYHLTPRLNAWARMTVWRAQGARVVTCANVLNVTPAAFRPGLIQEAYDLCAQWGAVFFAVHEGDRSGSRKETSRGYQNNLRLEAYLPEINEIFGNAEIDRKMRAIKAYRAKPWRVDP